MIIFHVHTDQPGAVDLQALCDGLCRSEIFTYSRVGDWFELRRRAFKGKAFMDQAFLDSALRVLGWKQAEVGPTFEIVVRLATGTELTGSINRYGAILRCEVLLDETETRSIKEAMEHLGMGACEISHLDATT